ncbi:cysteine desulfurase family protein [Clostridium gasigenes]|uniref:cysteine desulfurase n=2 Tax=Clostridium gasigenes TaxID=94869 RepID=A0A1H0VY69_9CLOT|nr:cysteine desulfurase family protein [Clostridium gasigenes]
MGDNMKKIYLDNAATSFPKALGMSATIANFIDNIGTSVNRGAYTCAYQAEDMVFDTRKLIGELFNFSNPENVVFTKNITESLNVLINGLLKEGDHVLVSSMEHNAVMRPLNALKESNISFSKIPCNRQGELIINEIEPLIKPNTKAIIMLHASNVSGTIMPLKQVGQLCKKHNLFFIVDAAQSAGILDIDMLDLNADAIAFTGHKGLLGPQGIGGFIISDNLNDNIKPLIYGGTGSLSDLEVQPSYMPDKFEAGTLNVPAIYGLNHSIKYLLKEGINTISDKELFLTDLFINDVLNINNINLVGRPSIDNRTAVVSLYTDFYDMGEIGYLLDRDFNIMIRIGLHCAPSAHKTLNTYPSGTMRFSFSHFNTIDDVKYTINSINKILKRSNIRG